MYRRMVGDFAGANSNTNNRSVSDASQLISQFGICFALSCQSLTLYQVTFEF